MLQTMEDVVRVVLYQKEVARDWTAIKNLVTVGIDMYDNIFH